jgi:hypothetical protein
MAPASLTGKVRDINAGDSNSSSFINHSVLRGRFIQSTDPNENTIKVIHLFTKR